MLTSSRYYLGADVGGTKTHILIANQDGQAVGFGEGGAGNQEMVGYMGLIQSLCTAFERAIASAGITPDQIAGAGFGVAGYDWPDQEAPTLEAIGRLGLKAPLAAVNDTILGLLAGSAEGWGVAVVSGTGCNCWGWDRTRQRVGRVTGGGVSMGEASGASELIFEAVQAVAHQWTCRGPVTTLTPAFLRHTGARDLPDLLSGLMDGRYSVEADAAPLVFQAAADGDGVAIELIHWAGRELGELAKAVIRQLGFEHLEFDVVQIGSLYDGSPLLNSAMRQTIHAVAPYARLVRLKAPPVVGSVLLGMEQAGFQPTPVIRQSLVETTKQMR